MSLSVYIAGPWVHKAEALVAKQQFEEAGFEVTSHWITYHSMAEIGNPRDEEELRNQAIEDLEDIARSDAFVIMNLGKSEGKAFEMGFAYSLEIPIILVGPKTTNIFYSLPGIIQAQTIEEVIVQLQEVHRLWTSIEKN